jgi:hypothetical protein
LRPAWPRGTTFALAIAVGPSALRAFVTPTSDLRRCWKRFNPAGRGGHPKAASGVRLRDLRSDARRIQPSGQRQSPWLAPSSAASGCEGRPHARGSGTPDCPIG